MNEFLVILAPLVGPLLTAGVKQVAPKIPKGALPYLSTVLSALAAGFAGADHAEAVTLGVASVGVRELVDRAKQGLQPKF